MLRAFVIGIFLSLAVLGVACSDEADDGNNSSDREQFIQDAEDRLASLRDDLEELRDDIATGDAGAEVEQQADALKGRIDDAEAKLDDVRAANDDNWEDFKGSVDEALGDAGDLIDEIGKELGID